MEEREKTGHFVTSQVHWVKREGRGDNKQMNHYKNEKKYFSNHIILWGNRGSSGDDDPTLPAGSYSLPFQFVLPENIPASFEGPKAHATGYVRYFCKATIGNMMYYCCDTQRKYFFVLGRWFRETFLIIRNLERSSNDCT